MAQPLPMLAAEKVSSPQGFARTFPGPVSSDGQTASKRWPPLPGRQGSQRLATAGNATSGNERKQLAVVGFPRASLSASRPTPAQTGRPSTSCIPCVLGFETSDSATCELAQPHKAHLEEENQRLRDELAKLQCSVMEKNRRPMAAIAGGGFRGSTSQQKTCNCDALQKKLSRCRAELRELQRKFSVSTVDSRPLSGSDLAPTVLSLDAFPPPPLEDAEVQSTPRTPPSPKLQPWCVPALPPVRSTSEVEVQTSPLEGPALVSVETQADSPSAQMCSAGVQAGTRPPVMGETAVQTSAAQVVLVESFVQAVASSSDAEAQAAPTSSEAVCQADIQGEQKVSVMEAFVQTNCVPVATSAATQTAADQCGIEEAVQADLGMAVAVTSELCVQTEGPRLAGIAVQTMPPKVSSVATQAAPGNAVHQAVQAVDDSALKEKAVREEQLRNLEARCKDLDRSSMKTSEECQKTKEDLQAWQQMAQSKALGQMNITILCPRAECTVNGTRIEVDSWNPAKLRTEFEENVLPRFTKVFVEEDSGEFGSQAKPEAVKRTMEEFAVVFRERLSAMLSAPNANAAVTAAAARASKSS